MTANEDIEPEEPIIRTREFQSRGQNGGQIILGSNGFKHWFWLAIHDTEFWEKMAWHCKMKNLRKERWGEKKSGAKECQVSWSTNIGKLYICICILCFYFSIRETMIMWREKVDSCKHLDHDVSGATYRRGYQYSKMPSWRMIKLKN